MEKSTKKFMQFLPIFGFTLSFLVSAFEFIQLVLRGIPDNQTLVANLLLLVNTLIILFIVYGLVKYDKRAFWLAMIASFLALVSLYSSPELKEFITLISGVTLLVNKKVLRLK